MSRTVHLCLDIRGALLNWSNRDFANMLKHDDGRPMAWREAKLALLDLVASGVKVIPLGKPCEGFSSETGCPGHETEDAT